MMGLLANGSVARGIRRLAEQSPDILADYDKMVNELHVQLGVRGTHGDYAALRGDLAHALDLCQAILTPVAEKAEKIERRHINLVLSGVSNMAQAAQEIDRERMFTALSDISDVLLTVRKFT